MAASSSSSYAAMTQATSRVILKNNVKPKATVSRRGARSARGSRCGRQESSGDRYDPYEPVAMCKEPRTPTPCAGRTICNLHLSAVTSGKRIIARTATPVDICNGRVSVGIDGICNGRVPVPHNSDIIFRLSPRSQLLLLLLHEHKNQDAEDLAISMSGHLCNSQAHSDNLMAWQPHLCRPNLTTNRKSC